MNVAEIWRESACTDDIEMAAWLKASSESPHDLAKRLYEREKKFQAEGNLAFRESMLLVTAVILLTYGCVNVVPDILDNHIPMRNYRLRDHFMRVAWGLIPFPDEVRKKDRREALAWFQDNKARLRWNEAEGRFVLPASEPDST